LGELKDYRDVAFFLALRDLKIRYKQTIFGVAWAIIQPVAAMAVLSVFLGRLAKVPGDHLPYPLFVLTGLVAWTYCSSAVSAAAGSLVENRPLVTKVSFPRVLAPIAATMPGLVDLAVSIVAVGALMAIYGRAPSLSLLLLPVWLVASVALVLGVGIWLSALNVLYRDVRYVLSLGIQLWLFLSPVVYPSSLIHGASRYLYALNPAVGVIDGFRWSLANAPAPPTADIISIVPIVVLLIGGLLYFGRVDRYLADRI
jgi:lipopolysaccharide transport system permease protein